MYTPFYLVLLCALATLAGLAALAALAASLTSRLRLTSPLATHQFHTST
jgi:hypothetical protein